MAGFLGITGGGGGVVGGAVVRLTLDVSKFDAGLNAAQTKLGAAASKMTAIGGSLTKFVTLPIVAVGAVATKMALDFEQAFTKIAAVTNTSQADIEGLKQSVLDLAGETARAPQELADALYFLSSAGLSASQVTETLDLSAKAAAVGMGETQDIAHLTANALNAYADSGLTATQVTDTLVAAIREGTAEPQEFADALGRILPIAHAAGVSFDEVAASLSVLSNVGLDVNEGVTAMRGLLQAMVAPGTQAADALNALGISAEQMRKVLSEGGLLAAMQLLMDASGGNLDVLKDIIPNVRSLTGELGIMGQDAASTAAIFDAVANSTGDLSEAFDETAKGPAFKMQQALAQTKVAMIELGAIILPVATKIVQHLAGIAEAFSKLSPGVQEAIVEVGLFVAALGPILVIGGNVIKVASAIGRGISLLSTAIGIATGATTTFGAALATLGVATGIAVIVAGIAAWIKIIHDHNAAIDENVNKLLTQSGAYDHIIEKSKEAEGGVLGLFQSVLSFTSGVDPFTNKVAEAGDAIAIAEAHIQALRDRFAELPGEMTAAREALIDNALANHDYATALELVTGALEVNREAIRAARVEFYAQRDAANAARDSLLETTGAAHGVIDAETGLSAPVTGANDALTDQAAAAQADADAMAAATTEAYNLINAQLQLAGGFLGILGASESLAGAQANLADVTSHLNDKNKDTRTSTADLEAAQLGLIQAQLGLTGSVESYTQGLLDSSLEQKDIIGLLKQQAAAAGLNAQQTQVLIDKVKGLIAKDELVPKDVDTDFHMNGLDSAISDVQSLTNWLYGIPNYIPVTIALHQVGSVSPGIQQFAASGGVLHANLMAAGGVRGSIPHGAGGFVTQAPVAIVGEGSDATRFGTGAEWVQPLSDHMLRRLATAIDDVRDKNGGGYKGGGDDVATAVERGMNRVMQNWVWDKRAGTVVLQMEGHDVMSFTDAMDRAHRRREALRS